MDSRMLQIADAVTEELNSRAWSLGFLAVRPGLRPRWNLEDLSTLRVAVLPRTFTRAINTRDDSQRVIEIEISVMGKIDVARQDDAEQELAGLLEEIADYWPLPGRLDAITWAVITAVRMASDQPANPGDLDDKNVFNGSVVLTFLVMGD